MFLRVTWTRTNQTSACVRIKYIGNSLQNPRSVYSTWAKPGEFDSLEIEVISQSDVSTRLAVPGRIRQLARSYGVRMSVPRTRFVYYVLQSGVALQIGRLITCDPDTHECVPRLGRAQQIRFKLLGIQPSA